ncbi:hypothetical protein [Pedobacter sp. JCM 36344]|uniref:hypothetical protein n=1 Tax=Pedobacter sp. JCM 36344 TaxID=3374280 RepID=UPI0039793026
MNTDQLVANTYPLTASGINDVMKNIQEMPPFELKAEAVELAADFKGWMAAHFELTAKQLVFLNGIDETTTTLTAQACSFALANGLPIYLEKGVKSMIEEEKPQMKIIRALSNLNANSGSDGNFSVGGYVTIQISYVSQ